MTPDETAAFATSVAGVAARYWARAADAGAGDAGGRRLSALWAAGADQGWFALGEEEALDAALAATRELGRVACPLPVADAFVAARVLGREEKVAGARRARSASWWRSRATPKSATWTRGRPLPTC